MLPSLVITDTGHTYLADLVWSFPLHIPCKGIATILSFQRFSTLNKNLIARKKMLSLDFKKFNNDSIEGQYWSLRKRLDAAFLTQSLQKSAQGGHI